tara:strand:+ start:244 stop:858 length:615 start_codon:yes stop_codon:yes gene_type:complete
MNNNLQDSFWKSKFGNSYTKRNNKKKVIQSLTTHYKSVFKEKFKTDIRSVFEFGTNRGVNLDIFKKLSKRLDTNGLEINKFAYKIASKNHKILNISAFDYLPIKKYDLVLSRVFLIHIHPKNLNKIYSKIYKSSKKYIYLEEYFNPNPLGINYRKNKNVLFKRDFVKDLTKKYKLKVLSYGFNWKYDDKKPLLDDTTWFLLKKL